MNRKIVWIISVSTVLVALGALVYKVILPSYVAEMIVSETPPSYLPEKYKIQVERLQKPLGKYSQELFRISDSLDLSLEQILRIIDSIDPEQVLMVYDELENKTVENSGDVYNIILKHVEVSEIDLTQYKKIFQKHATPARINRILRYAETHELIATIAPSTAKKIAKQLVIKNYELRKTEFSQ